MNIPPSKHYNLTHYQQRYNWDCGISCILMILSTTQRKEFINNFDSICQEEGFGYSTWTIDLCYLLHRYHVKHEYFTQTLGIDPNYRNHMYYSHIIDKDEKRVLSRFTDAKANGLHVEQRTVDMNVIVKHLARHGPIILLTNASMLTCSVCSRRVHGRFGYAGHYVVLCGYDISSRNLFYRNPEVHDGHICRCFAGDMDIARTAYGTDQDIIFIYDKSHGQK